jgi:hypothetical protein
VAVAPLALEVLLARVVGWLAEEVQEEVHAEVQAEVKVSPNPSTTPAWVEVVVGCSAVVGSAGASVEVVVGTSTKTAVDSTGAGAVVWGSAGSTLETGSGAGA